MLQGRSRVLGLVAAALLLATAVPAQAAPDSPFSVVFGTDQQRKPPVTQRGVAFRHPGNVLTFDPKGAGAEPTLYTEFKPGAPTVHLPRVPNILRPALKLLHLLSANRL